MKKKAIRNWPLWAFLSAVTLSAGAEVFLRWFGLCQGAIYVSDPDYEYMHAPNQRTRPFGNLLETNEFGMRSRPIRGDCVVRALVVGDSVINGGNPTPQEALATSILEAGLQRRNGEKERILNVSAGSWGPDNAAAFLRRHGLFGARAIIAVFSSHDIGDIMTHEPVVGVIPSFPASKSRTAIGEAIFRYAWPRLRPLLRLQSSPSDGLGINKFQGQVNPGWRQLREIATRADIPFVALLHRTKAEFMSKSFDEQGRQLIAYLEASGIPVEFESGFQLDSYRDQIHLSNKGQADLARVLAGILNQRSTGGDQTGRTHNSPSQ